MSDTRGNDYARRLDDLAGRRWKRWLNVQAPYQRRLRRQGLGRTLDIGCGIGRNLATLASGSVGVDHNEHSVAIARSRGFVALTSDEWMSSPLRQESAFDALLLAHVAEHMTYDEAVALLGAYLPALRPGGRVLLICPQERGYLSDDTHVTFLDGPDLQRLAREVGLVPETPRSFPLPRAAGRYFTYNETSLLARRPEQPTS